MKRLMSVSAFAATLVLLASACHAGGVKGSGVRKTEKRDVPAFTKIETTGAFQVEITCQAPVSFEIEGDDNLLPLIQTEVRNGVLHVSSTRSYNSHEGIALRIKVPSLDRVNSTGAGKFHITDLKNETFELSSTGATTVVAAGQSKSVTIKSTGAGKVDTHNLLADRAEVDVTGAAGVDVFARDELDVSVSGAGRVTYSGNPKVTKHISGAGQVTKKESGPA